MSENKGHLSKGREGRPYVLERMAGKCLPVSGKLWHPGPLNYFSVSKTRSESRRRVFISCENILGAQLHVHFSSHSEKAVQN